MFTGTFHYPEELSMLGEGGKLLYDIDFTDLRERKLKDIGLFEGRTLTVVDEEEDRVNVELLISEGNIRRLEAPDLPEIPKKPVEAKHEASGVENGMENGVENGTGKKRLREDDDDMEFRKKARVAVEGDKDGVILIDEDDDTVMIE